jgi:uncharacterized membrane-anchored protein/uncharacterized membrane protein
MKIKIIQIGYVIGISLILAGILYFCASNWQGFVRSTKIGLSASITLVFYGISFLFMKLFHHHSFLIKGMFIAASISFGISLALIGQLYNSHADSYWLFFIWLIPILLFSFITKYQTFYVMSYILFHASLYFYFFPSSRFIDWEESHLFFVFLSVALLNYGLFILFSKKIIRSPLLKYVSLSFCHFLLIAATISETFESWGFWFNFIYIPFLLFHFYLHYRKQKNMKLVILLSIISSLYLLVKGIELANEFFAIGFLLLLLFFVGLILFGSIKITSLLKRNGNSKKLKSVIIITVTFLCSILSTIAIIGIISLIMGDISFFILFVFSFVFLVIPALVYTDWNGTLRFTLISTGYMISIIATIFDSNYVLYYVSLFLLLLFGLFKIHSIGMKIFQYILLNAITCLFLSVHVMDKALFIFLSIFSINVIVHSFLYFYKHKSIQQTAFFVGMIAFLCLVNVHFESTLVMIFVNSGYFLLTTFYLFYTKQKEMKVEFYGSVLFWFAFLGNLYYDYAWKLIDKSIVLFILGFLFLSISFYKDRSKEGYVPFLSSSKKLYGVLLVVFLQFICIGVQVYSNEHLLREGQQIKLILEPVDPRSLMQGDYITLRYSISTIDELQYHNLSANERITVVLRKNKEGIYDYSGYYYARNQWNKPYKKQKDDIKLNGKSNGWTSVSYGIEHYFIPEQTGRTMEEKTKYAHVRVSKNGNSILASLSPHFK